jgi:hypothetical protein
MLPQWLDFIEMFLPLLGLMKLSTVDDDAGGEDPPGDIEPPPGEDTPPVDPPPEDTFSFKHGETEMSREDVTNSLNSFNASKKELEVIAPLLKAVGSGDKAQVSAVMKEMFGEDEELPTDEKGKTDYLFNESQQRKMDDKALTVASSIDIEGFDIAKSIHALADAGLRNDPKTFHTGNFEKQLTMAHKAVAYDDLKKSFDAKVTETVTAQLKIRGIKADAADVNGSKGGSKGGKGDLNFDSMDSIKSHYGNLEVN